MTHALPGLTPIVFALALLSAMAPAPAQLIVAHRGASHDAPENTLAAFRLAWEQGADAIEGDFHLTADGRIVCIHDKDAKRVAGVDRRVAEMTLAEAQALDVGTWKDARFASERPPSLRQALEAIPEGKLFFIEIKSGVEIMPALTSELSRSPVPHERLRIISFHADVIAACRRDLPSIRAYWLTGFKQDERTGAWSPTPGEVLDTLRRTGATGLDAKAELQALDAGFVQALRSAGMEFHAWTVDDPDVARRLAALGVDSITTNRPALIRAALSAR